jgi:predicted membrane protein
VIALGFIAGVAIAAPVFYAIGRFGRRTHGLDISAALRGRDAVR